MKNDNHIIASVATALVMALLFLLLWLVTINQPYVPEEEGIEVAFGETETGELGGGASAEQAEEPVVTPVPPAPAVTAPSAPSSNDLLVAEDETLRLQKQAEEKKRKEAAAAAEAERKKKAAEEAERQRKAAEEAAAAAQKAAAEQAARDKAASMMAGKFGKGNSTGATAGTGNNTGSGTAGNPVGHGSSNGQNWSLAGRKLNNTLSKPAYDGLAEGTVVVEIRVDKNGTVVSAKRGAGTNTGDQQLIDAAIAEARKAKFSAGDGDVIGSITYTFKLR